MSVYSEFSIIYILNSSSLKWLRTNNGCHIFQYHSHVIKQICCPCGIITMMTENMIMQIL